MKPEEAVSFIEGVWEAPDGAFFRLRRGQLDEKGLTVFVNTLRTIEIDEGVSVLPRRLVSLLWYAPQFMQWQEDRVHESGGDMETLSKLTTLVINELERILGIP